MASLRGARVVVTRAAHQARDLATLLAEMGAEVILLPTIGIAPPLDPAPLRQAAAELDDYDWVIFTSANGVHAFVAEMPRPVARCKARVATIGAATREAAEQCGFTIRITPDKYVAESLVEAFHAEELSGRRLLIPSAAITRDVVATELRKRGADVTVIEAYRNVLPAETRQRAPQIFREPYPDWITFTSSSAFENLFQIVGAEPLRHANIATIGPITSATVRRGGLTVAVEAATQTVEAMVVALSDYQCPGNTEVSGLGR